MSTIRSLLADLGLLALRLAASYSALTYAAVIAWQLRRPAAGVEHPSPTVSILKPLCGAEPGLYENLRSFCSQRFAEFEVVFGVCEASDAALLVVERLIAEFPALPISVVIDPRQHGGNRKVSSLINMIERSRYDVLVLADSDARVNEDYLSVVIAPLSDLRVGLVTSIYRGTPTSGLWSNVGAMYVNEWYVPSVLLAWLFGHRNYVSGQTICLRRDTLEGAGGLRAIANHLADDYQLGALVRGVGKKIVLSGYVPQAEHHESSFRAMVRHETRWMRTIKVLKPRSFRLLFLSFSFPIALAGMALAGPFAVHATLAWCLFGAATLGRLLLHLHYRKGTDLSYYTDLWLIPVRDVLVLWAWCNSFQTAPIIWRGTEFRVDHDGVMRPLP